MPRRGGGLAEDKVIVIAIPGTAPRSHRAVTRDSTDLARAMTDKDAKKALVLLMDRFGGRIYNFCRGMLGDDAEAEDVSQTAFLQAFEAIRRGCPVENPYGWLRGIARHRCLDRIDARRRSPVPVGAEELERALDREEQEDKPIRDLPLQEALDACVDELDPRSRMVLLLRFREQLSYEEIARRTGDQPGALRVRVARALSALRLALKRRGIEF
jgi:RNA polymerase sigma-70 factor (ECF subfamily)